MRYLSPQPYEEMSHTADVGVRVEGSSAEEALARLVLALGSMLAGGGRIALQRQERLELRGEGFAEIALAVLRELLYRFATERVIPGACEVVRFGETGVELIVEYGPYDPAQHGEGTDVKAVTYHAARFERTGGLWRAQVLFDV
jgi:SHS2 domain-containing protein